MNTKIKLLLIFLIILSVGTNIFLVLKINDLQKNSNSTPEGSFRLIKPFEKEDIDSNIQDKKVILHYNGLNETLEQEIKWYKATGKVSIFLQDIKTGAWLGINEKEGFLPASLLKIPIMMGILKKVERGELDFKDKIELVLSDMDTRSGTLYEKGAGANISVEDLLKEMILSSDNTAKNALKRQLSAAEINAVFAHVGIPNPYIEGNPTVSPRGYTRILKSLYYSTFLSSALSEKALDLTTDTQDENLISKGVPPEIQVAHKFGMTEDGLHDCGIIYHPENPYFLCIMTKDLELEINKKVINQISKDVFEFVDKK